MISRDKLYALVWSEPMTRVAERFEVSGSYLARICTFLNVPRPERGYWAKLAVGKAPQRPALPEPLPGDPVQWSKEGEPVRIVKPQAPTLSKLATKPIRIARDRLHGLVRGTEIHFRSGRPVDDGAYLRPYKKLLVDVTASKAALDKALNLANDLFNALESVGHRVVLAPSDAHFGRERGDVREVASDRPQHWEHDSIWSPSRPTVAYIGTVAIGLAVVEMSEHVALRYTGGGYVRERDYVAPRGRYADHSWTTTQDVPSGRLRIVAYAPYRQITWSTQWQETKAASLRGQIKAIVTAIEAAAPGLVELIEEAERQAEIRRQEWEAQQERWRREEDRKQIEQSIANSKADLHAAIEGWSASMEVERFLAGVEQRAREVGGAGMDDILRRLDLARTFIGTQDPLEFFRGWRSPKERYAPRYPSDEAGGFLETNE